MGPSAAFLTYHLEARPLPVRHARGLVTAARLGSANRGSASRGSANRGSANRGSATRGGANLAISAALVAALLGCGTEDRQRSAPVEESIVAGGLGAEPAVPSAPPIVEVPNLELPLADAGAGMAADAGVTPPAMDAIPLLLSQTGLFETDPETLEDGVRPYEPRFPLWSDGAAKRRWVYLPEGAQIDTSNMEYWSYPPGTRLYKEFSVDGRKIETRLMHRQENGAWWFMSYQWREDGSDADAVPAGVRNALGTQHDIPSTEDCRTCHLRMPDKALGFSAIQLTSDREPLDDAQWTLDRLQAEGKLTNQPPDIRLFPENELGQEVLGFLHGNCGHCHNPRSSVSSRVAISLWLRTDQLGSIEQTPAYLTTVGQRPSLSVDGRDGPLEQLIAPGSPEASVLFVRASSRGESYSMPPLSTKQIDPVAIEFMRQWITLLPPAFAQPLADPAAAPEAAAGTSEDEAAP